MGPCSERAIIPALSSTWGLDGARSSPALEAARRGFGKDKGLDVVPTQPVHQAATHQAGTSSQLLGSQIPGLGQARPDQRGNLALLPSHGWAAAGWSRRPFVPHSIVTAVWQESISFPSLRATVLKGRKEPDIFTCPSVTLLPGSVCLCKKGRTGLHLAREQTHVIEAPAPTSS